MSDVTREQIERACEEYLDARADALPWVALPMSLWLLIAIRIVPDNWTQGVAFLGIIVFFIWIARVIPRADDLAVELRARSSESWARARRRRLFGPLAWFDLRTGALYFTPLWIYLVWTSVYGSSLSNFFVSW